MADKETPPGNQEDRDRPGDALVSQSTLAAMWDQAAADLPPGIDPATREAIKEFYWRGASDAFHLYANPATRQLYDRLVLGWVREYRDYMETLILGNRAVRVPFPGLDLSGVPKMLVTRLREKMSHEVVLIHRDAQDMPPGHEAQRVLYFCAAVTALTCFLSDGPGAMPPDVQAAALCDAARWLMSRILTDRVEKC